MNVRILQYSDIHKVRELHSKYYESEFPFPDKSSAIGGAVAEEDGIVQGFGVIKLIAEPVLIIDQSLSMREKVLLFKTMLTAAIKNVRMCGISQMYITVADEKFAEILKKHYAFSEVEGKSLVLSL